MATDSKPNGAITSGMYFVRAFGGKGKASGRDFGRVTVVNVDDKGTAEVIDMWCDRVVAERAARDFVFPERVEVETEQRAYQGSLRAQLVAVHPAS